MKKILLKVGGSLILLSLVLSMTDIGLVLERIRHVNALVIIACMCMLGIAQAVSSLRWQWILRAEGATIPLGYLFSSYMVGMFANNFLPTNIGGDIIKTYDVYRVTRNLSLSLVSVFIERFSGFLVLIVFSWIGISLVWHVSSSFVFWIWIVMNAIAALALIAFFEQKFIEKTMQRMESGMLAKVVPVVRRSFETLKAYRNRKALFAKLFLVSIPVQLFTILVYRTIAGSVSVDIPFVYYLFGVPLIVIVSLLPVSLGGLGVREAVTVLLFGVAGIPSDAALSIALIFTAVTYLASLLGGIFLFFRNISINEISKIYKSLLANNG